MAATVDAAAEVDLTFVQLLLSARRSSEALGQTFTLAAPADGALHETLRRGGFLSSPEDQRFWLHHVEKA